MKNQVISLFALLLVVTQLVVITGCQKTQADRSGEFDPLSVAASRHFEFHYGATINGVPKGATVRVWIPVAETNGQQQVTLTKTSTPSELQLNRDATYSNQIGFFEFKPSDNEPLDFGLDYDVVRNVASVDGVETELTDYEKQLFLSANALVPVDGKPQELIQGTELPADSVAAGQALYNVVETHMKYDKSQPGYGNGDASWACDSKTGNCTDFHSLFISLARSRSIPARFEIGFPIPNNSSAGIIGGYHCWAWFHAEGTGWSPVDISEADKHPEMKDYFFGKLTADRVSFSKGRDIELVPNSENGPLNYFVYPHVEVDGEPWPKEKIEFDFSFVEKQ